MCQKGVVRTLLDDPAVLEHHEPIHPADGGEAATMLLSPLGRSALRVVLVAGLAANRAGIGVGGGGNGSRSEGD